MPLHVVLELLERLAAASAGVLKIPADEASFWPVDLPATLERSGLLELASPLETVTCPGCDEACLMPVEIRVHGNSRPGSAFVVCDRRDDIGLVPLRPDQIRCWQLSGAVAARVLAATLQLLEPRQPAPPLPCWTLGVLELPTGVITVHFSLVPLDQESALRLHGVGDGGRSHLLLLPPGVSCASLPANVRAVDLGEVLEWNGQGISLSPADLARRLGSPVPLELPPFLFRRDAEGNWTIRFDDRDCPSMPDRVGLRHLYHLLQNAGRLLSARELSALEQGFTGGASPRSTTAVAVQEGFSIRDRDPQDELLDKKAMQQYRAELTKIERALDALPPENQAHRAKLERDRKFLVTTLKQAAGVTGRLGRASADDNKIRSAITKAIKRTISDLTGRCPQLGLHLTQSIRTGHSLSYAPAPPVPWVFY
jgi:hypothetical protein